LQLKSAAEGRRRQDYDRLMASGRAALLDPDPLGGLLKYYNAVLHADAALQLYPDDAAGLKLKDDALAELASRDARLAVALRGDLDARLAGVLRGEEKPADAAESLALMKLCLFKQRYAAAVRLAEQGFALYPHWADYTSSDYRYLAAACAVLASAGRGIDAGDLDDAGRARLRRQALAWLRADLEVWGRTVKSKLDDPDLTEQAVRDMRAWAERTLRHWQRDVNLAPVRDTDALANLPADERRSWQQFWEDVDALMRQAGGPK